MTRRGEQWLIYWSLKAKGRTEVELVADMGEKMDSAGGLWLCAVVMVCLERLHSSY